MTKHIQLYEQFIAINEAKITNKDLDRMLDLVMQGGDGATVAKLIKDKDKAIARFVAGLKLDNSPLVHDPDSVYSPYGRSSFSELGNKAIDLGATPQEIQDLYDRTTVPEAYFDKMARLGGKKLNNRFVGQISKAVIDAGYDIIYQPHNGRALTMDGRYAMERNGRKWTIGYQTLVDLGDRQVPFEFDVITDEGDGPSLYVLDGNASDPMFRPLGGQAKGRNEFIAKLKTILNSQERNVQWIDVE